MSGSTHAAVRFSDAQLGVLDVLGIVPWVRRDGRLGASAAELACPATPAASSAASNAPAVSTRSEPAPSEQVPAATSHDVTPMPAGLAELGDWLAARPLAGFARRGERRHETGPDASCVLVLCEAAAQPPSLLPIERHEAALLASMMRATGLAPGDWSAAVLADPARDEVASGSHGAPRVGQRLHGRRAVLWLVREPGDPGKPGASEAQRFAVAGVPAFRVPHPASLLLCPALKRQAWQVLKAMRNLLAGA